MKISSKPRHFVNKVKQEVGEETGFAQVKLEQGVSKMFVDSSVRRPEQILHTFLHEQAREQGKTDDQLAKLKLIRFISAIIFLIFFVCFCHRQYVVFYLRQQSATRHSTPCPSLT